MQAPKQNTDRTSAAQLRCLSGFLCTIFKCLAHHIHKWGLIYGFLLGCVGTLATLGAVTWYGVLAFPIPWKVIDGTDPRFDPMQFEFTDYENSQTLGKTLRTMFPPGTDKTEVDKILGDVGGAKITRFIHPNVSKQHIIYYSYTYHHLRNVLVDVFIPIPTGQYGYAISIEYDKKNKVKNIHITSP